MKLLVSYQCKRNQHWEPVPASHPEDEPRAAHVEYGQPEDVVEVFDGVVTEWFESVTAIAPWDGGHTQRDILRVYSVTQITKPRAPPRSAESLLLDMALCVVGPWDVESILGKHARRDLGQLRQIRWGQQDPAFRAALLRGIRGLIDEYDITRKE